MSRDSAAARSRAGYREVPVPTVRDVLLPLTQLTVVPVNIPPRYSQAVQES